MTAWPPADDLSLSHFFNNERYSDVEFVVQGTRRFKCHKIILSLSSEPLAAMLNSSMREGTTGLVEVSDIDEGVFEILLRYMYCCEISIVSDNVFEVLEAAKRYDVVRLVERCAGVLEQHTDNLDMIFAILEAAMKFHLEGLADKCCAKILSGDQRICLATTFVELSADVVKQLLRCDSWTMPEDDIWDLVLKWTQINTAEVAPHQAIQPFLPFMRYPFMSAEKLFELKQGGWVPHDDLLNATFFKLGHCNPELLHLRRFHRRQASSDFEFEPSSDFEIACREGGSCCIRRTGIGWRVVRGKRRMGSGRHEMNFKVLRKPGSMMFGVMDADDTSPIAYSNSGRMVGCYTQSRYHRGQQFPRREGDYPIREGDVVLLVLDLGAGTLQYSVNQGEMETPFGDVRNSGPCTSEFVFAIDMYKASDEVAVLPVATP
mmetsp:Transcript_52620/g.112702  ORF Transcript_52620/g.112702 Transcript_52620/m.112702 type:complete len:432 (+) Transcript_52620:52-1347(+)